MTAVAPAFGRWIIALLPTLAMSAGAFWVDLDFVFFTVPIALVSMISGLIVYMGNRKSRWWMASFVGGWVAFVLGLALSTYLASQS